MESQRTNNGAAQPSSTVQTPVCEICGQDFDVSKNLVVTTCKPCRRFLRKFEKTQLHERCLIDGECEVTLENRSECGPCRYNKYLKIRMERDSTTTPSAVNRAVTFSSLNRFHQQQMLPAVDQAQENEESCKLCEQAPQGRRFKVMQGLLMCGRCRVLVAHNVKNQVNNPSNVCLRDDGICSDYPSLTSCSVCLFEKYKNLVTKAPKTKKSRAVSFRIATCPQNYTPTVHQGFVPTTSGVNQPPSEAVIPPPVDSTVSTTSSAPVLQKYIAPEQCKICGDTVAILGNFGGVACGACVDFYSRKLTSRHHQECKNAKRCKITVKNRNSCPTCRFEKCKALGMVDKKSVGTFGNKNQNNEVAPDHSQEIENQIPASSSDQWNGRKRPAETMLQDYGNHLAPNEHMEMCKLCKRVPEQYPHQLFQGIRVCEGCTNLVRFRAPAQIKCQKGNGECRIYCWVVDCSSCILKEFDELVEMDAARSHGNNSKVPNIADRDFSNDLNGSHMKRSRMQVPVPYHQDQEGHLHASHQFDDNNGHYSQQMEGYSNEGYPSVSDSMNLEHHNQNVADSSLQIDEVNPGASHYSNHNSDPIDMNIGKKDTFTMTDRDIFGDQTEPNDPQLFDHDNGHYSDQIGFQNQGYFDDINFDNQNHSHNEDQSWNLQLEGLISPSKTYISASENMEYQNQNQDDEFSIPQIEKLSGNSNPSEIDNMSVTGNNSLGLHPEQGYPGTSDNINLNHQNHSQEHTYSMEYQKQNQENEYSKHTQIEKITPEMSYYHSGSPDIIETDNGQNLISAGDQSYVDTFTMSGRGNNHFGYPEKEDQNTSLNPKLFDDNNGHYSEQMGLNPEQGYSGVPDNKTLSHQNHNQEHHSSMEENSDSEIIVIGEKVTTQVNSKAVNRIPMSGAGNLKRSRMLPPPNSGATVFVQRKLSTDLKQHLRVDGTDKRILVRSSKKSSISLSNPDRRAQNSSKVWQKADHLPTKFLTAPQILTGRPSRAPPVVPGPLQQQDTNIMRNDTFRHRQRPNVQYEIYGNQNMTNQPAERIMLDRSYQQYTNRNTVNGITAHNESVMRDRDCQNHPDHLYATEPIINQSSTSQARSQTDRMHQYRSRNHRHNGPFAQDFSENVAQNGVPIEPNVSDLYDSRDLHHYPQQVQDHTERYQTPLSSSTSSNPYTQLGNRLANSDQDGESNNSPAYEFQPQIYQYQPRNLAPEAEQIHEDGGIMHDNPNESAPQQVHDDDEDDEFRIGTHEDDFDPDEFEGLLNDIPEEFN